MATIAMLLACAPCGLAQASSSSAAGESGFYIGTYSEGKSKGIYHAVLSSDGNKLSSLTLAAESANPTFLAMHPNKPWLYAINEIGNFEGKRSGSISAFEIDPGNSALRLLNRKTSVGTGPCHLSVDAAGKTVLAANYSGGSVVTVPILEGGLLGEPASFCQHTGSSINPQRQKEPHAHGIYPDKSSRFALVADLGLDKVLVYSFDAAKGTLSTNQVGGIQTTPGAGPRHLAFHPNNRFVYSINELQSTITAFEWNEQQGALKEIHTVTTLPEGFKGDNSTAEIQIHPLGKFLYGSNRGHDSIAVFQVDIETGKLTQVQVQSSGGKSPRSFSLDPTGRFLLAANQGSGNVVPFKVNPTDGRISVWGEELKVPSPVCVLFVKQP